MNVPQLILSFWLTIAHQEKINLGYNLHFDVIVSLCKSACTV